MHSILTDILAVMVAILGVIGILLGLVAIALFLLYLIRRFLRFLWLLGRVVWLLPRQPAVTAWPRSPDGHHASQTIVSDALVLAVIRDGPDVLMQLHGIGYIRSRLHLDGLRWIRCDATVRFTGCSRITSRSAFFNASPEMSKDLRLEPGWRLDNLSFDGVVALMAVSWEQPTGFEQMETFPVVHGIHCDGVRMTRATGLADTLFSLIFRGPSGIRVGREPVHSPPIPGQDQEAFGGSRT